MVTLRWLLAIFFAALVAGCGVTQESEVGSTSSRRAALEGSAPASAPDSHPPCQLLDDPALRRRLGSALEAKLLVLCGRAAKSSQITIPPETKRSSLSRAALTASGNNILVNDPSLDKGGSTQSETSVIAIGNVVCAAWNDAGEGFGMNGFAGFGYSLDGGQTFKDGGPFPVGTNGDLSFGDPSLAYSVRDHAIYFGSLSSAGLSLWRSSDNCQSFQYVGAIHQAGQDDKELIAIDNSPASPFFGRIHVGWTAFGGSQDLNVAAHSDDSGLSWSNPVSLPGSGTNGQGSFPAVAPNGDVFVALVNRAFDIGGHQDQWIFRSTDGGNSWQKQSDIGTDQLQPEDAPTSADCGRQALNGDIRNLSSPQIAITADVTAPAGYVIHAVYPYDSDGAGPDHSNVFYRQSSDAALSWSSERKLNDDATNTDQFYPAIGVGETGVLAVSWYDRRLDPVGNLLIDRYLTVSTDGGSSFAANERLSDVSSPVAQTNPNFDGLAQCYHGDYDEVAVSGNVAHVVWADDRRITATGPNPDVYYEQVAINPHLGRLRASQAAVGCSASISFVLTDSDLVGAGSQAIVLQSTTGDAETLVLSEDLNQPGSFSGTIATAGGVAVPNDGILQVANQATLTATYQDANDGSGKPAVAVATVGVDCSPPLLSNIRVTSLSGAAASIAANVSEPALLRVDYGFSCGDLSQTASSTLSPAPTVVLNGLFPGVTYFYVVTATDAEGNSSRADNGGSCYSFKTLDLIYSQDFAAGLGGFELDNGGGSEAGGGGASAAGGFPGKGGAPGGGGATNTAGSIGDVGDAGEAGGDAAGAPNGGSGGGASAAHGLWHLSESCESVAPGHSRPTTLYYGQDSNCTYNNGFANKGFATSPQITLGDASFASLEFNYFLGTEGGGFFDQASVEISVNGGPFQVISSNFTSLIQPDPDEPPSHRTRLDARPAGRYALLENSGKWQHASFDLTQFLDGLPAAQIQIRFHFDTIDPVANSFAGFLVDDLTVFGKLAPVPCTLDENCDDGLFCTGTEHCEQGFCDKGVPVECSAASDVACAETTCDETIRGCVTRPNDAACDDGLFCNGKERCDLSAGCRPGTPVLCPSAVSCVVGSCREDLKACVQVADDKKCDDGLFCSGVEFCDPKLGCQSSSPPCIDGVGCTIDTCDETAQTCHFMPDDALCNDGLFCNGQESCDALQGCVSSGTPCAVSEKCDETSNQCVPVCFTDSNAQHRALGRAYSKKVLFFALGSNDGLGKSADVTSLRGSGNFWQRVPSCPAPPSIETLNVVVSGSVAKVTGTASDPNDDIREVRLTFSVNLSFDISFDALGTTSFSGSLSLPTGFHSVTAQALDRAGFESGPMVPIFFQVLPPAPPNVETLSVAVSGQKVTVSGTASDPNNDVEFVEITLVKDGEVVASVQAKGTTSFNGSITGLAAGQYTARAQAFDSTGFVSLLDFSPPFQVMQASCFTDTNQHQVNKERAKLVKGSYFAVGSNDALGKNAAGVTSLSGSPGFWEKVKQCP